MTTSKPMNAATTRSDTDGPDTHDMVVVHRIFRREFRLLPDLVRATPEGDAARAGCIAGHAELILTGLHHHHSAEDEYLWPLLLERAQPGAELVLRMEAQHQVVGEHILDAQRLLGQWREAPAAGVGDELDTTFTQLSAALIEHLDEEEAKILPLVREHLTVAEWEELGQRAFAKFPRSALPIVLGELVENTTPAEAAEFFGKLPAHARLVWRLAGRRRYARYIRRVRGPNVPEL